VRSPTKPTALALRRSGICAMLACRTSLWRWITRSGERARRSFRDAAWWRAPVDIRPELTDGTAARRSGDARAPGAESSRATGVLRQAGCRGAVRAGPESRPDHGGDRPHQPDRMERLDLGADRDDTVDRRHGPSARRPSPAQSKTDGSTGTVGLDWPRRFGPRRCDQLDRALVRLATHGRLIAESRSDA